MLIGKIIQYILSRYKHRGKAVFPYGAIVARDAVFEGGNKIGKGTIFSGKLGFCSYIGSNCSLFGDIGRFTSIASNCKVLKGMHAYTYPFVSSSPVFYSLLSQTTISFANKQMFKEHKFADEQRQIMVKVGNDCWINSDVKLISGVSIGDGAVVLAGAVVAKDVPPYAIVGGIPARVLRYRFSEEDIEFLKKSEWWNKDEAWLRQNWEAMCDFEFFKTHFSLFK